MIGLSMPKLPGLARKGNTNYLFRPGRPKRVIATKTIILAWPKYLFPGWALGQASGGASDTTN